MRLKPSLATWFSLKYFYASYDTGCKLDDSKVNCHAKTFKLQINKGKSIIKSL